MRRVAQTVHRVIPAMGLCVALSLLPLTAAAQTNDFVNGQPAAAVVGQTDFSATVEELSATGLVEPRGVAADSTRRKLYVVDNEGHRVLRYDLDEAMAGSPTAEAVFGQADMTSDENPGPPTAASMDYPGGLALDAAGRLYVADSSNNRVLRFDNAATASSGAAASAVLGQPDFTSAAPNYTQEGLAGPIGLAIGPDGELWVGQLYRISRWDAPATAANGAPADGVLGQVDFTAAVEDLSAVYFGSVYALAISSDGTLFVADTMNNRVLRFDDAINKSNGAAADGVLGQPDFVTTSQITGESGMEFVAGLAVDSNGRLYVTDSVGLRVLWFDNAASLADGAPADGVLGQADPSGTTVSGDDRTLSYPMGLALSTDNRLWVADTENDRVLLFSSDPLDVEEEASTPPVAPAQCAQLPDIALSPERIELAAGGRTTITITMRNLCADAPFSQADLLLSLSDGLSVADLPAGWLDLGQRAALQGLSLGLGETRSWTLTVAAADPLPTAPLHVLELYYRGAAAVRIDGVFVPAVPEVPAAVVVPAVVEAPAAAASPPAAALPTVLPNTAGPLLPLGALALSGLALAAAGAIGRRLR
jgi:sugar lactone lactonase YvrE